MVLDKAPGLAFWTVLMIATFIGLIELSSSETFYQTFTNRRQQVDNCSFLQHDVLTFSCIVYSDLMTWSHQTCQLIDSNYRWLFEQIIKLHRHETFHMFRGNTCHHVAATTYFLS